MKRRTNWTKWTRRKPIRRKEAAGRCLQFCTLTMAHYTPLKGSSYLLLTKKLKKKKVIVNIKNEDNKCIIWSVLAALLPVAFKFNSERIHYYRPFLNELNFAGIESQPVCQIPTFEKQNKIAVNVFGFQVGTLFALHISKERCYVHVNLLLYFLRKKEHYCLIGSLNRLLSSQTWYKGRM